MDEFVKSVFTAPVATLFIVAGILFLLIAVVGNISGRLEPGVKGRIASGVLGLTFVLIGLAMHLTQKVPQMPGPPVTSRGQIKRNPLPEAPRTPADGETELPTEPPVSVPSTEKKESEPAPISATGEEVIEAGCGFYADEIDDAPGSTHTVACPAGCAESSHLLFGTDVYTGDSSICKAAIHAGLIDPQGGSVGVILDKGRPAYRGSIRNKIQSYDLGKTRSSFRLAPLKQ